MTEDELEAAKKDLIELLGVHFEKEKHLPPLAARILSTLILIGMQGITFEELVTELEAGKGSICTHLNSLIAQQKVTYFTKSGDRKRYFTLAPGYIIQKIDQLNALWNMEIDLHRQVCSYKAAYNEAHPSEQLSLAFHENSLQFLTRAIEYFEKQRSYYQLKEK